MNGIFIMDKIHFDNVYSKEDRKIISNLISIKDKVYTQDDIKNHPELLSDINIIMSSWGAPKLDLSFLNNTPNLKAFFYAAGSIRNFVTDDFFDLNIPISSAWAANAIPVAEFTYAQIILSLKNLWKYNTYGPRIECASNYKSNVGIISLGMIGKLVAKKLKDTQLNVFAYDPFENVKVEKTHNLKLVSLDYIFKNCDVITLHTPLLKETVNMINKNHFELMKYNATFINTARGAIVNEKDLIDIFSKRSDLTALLDVTNPEPPTKDSLLHSIENIHLTPHIAGSFSKEQQRLGLYMTQELIRFLNHEDLKYNISKQMSITLA